MYFFRFVLVLALSVVAFSLTADAKPKRCGKHPYISYFPIYETTYDHSNGRYERSKYDQRKKPRRYDECWEPLKGLLHIHKTSDHQIQNLTYFSYGETCAANAIGYLKIYGTDRFFSNGTSTFAQKFFGDEEFFDGVSRNILDTTKDVCSRYPDTLKLLIAFDALYDNEPELARTQKYHWPYWKQGYEGDFYVRQDGTYKIVDVDPKLRRWANRDRRNDWHKRQIERFDRADTIENAFADLDEADKSGRGFLGIQIEEFAPEVTWQKLAFRKELGPSIRIAAVDPAGPMCRAGLSSGDVINSIRSYVPNKGMIKVGSYWTSYTLDATILPTLLLDVKADQLLLVDWLDVSARRYRQSVVRTVGAPQNQEYRVGNACKLPNDRLEALSSAADDFHYQAVNGDLSSNTRIFAESRAFARQSIAALNQQKGSADIAFESVLTRSNIDRIPNQWFELSLDDLIVPLDVSTRLSQPNSVGLGWNGSSIYAGLDPNTVYSDRQISELVQELHAASFIDWYSKDLRKLSSNMERGLFNPYWREIHLAFRGFGRPSLYDPFMRSMVRNSRQIGEIPPSSFMIRRSTPEAVARWIDDPRSPGLSASAANAAVMQVLRYPTPSALRDFEFIEAMTDFYENAYLGFNSSRSGDIRDRTEKTWNGRFGPPSEDKAFQYFLSREMSDFEQNYPADAAILQRAFDSQDASKAQTIASMSPNGRAKLISELKAYNTLSTPMLLVPFGETETYQELRSLYLERLRVFEYYRHVKPGKVFRG